MLKNFKRWYKKTFVEGTLEYRWAMVHHHWEAEQEASESGRRYERVSDSLLEQM